MLLRTRNNLTKNQKAFLGGLLLPAIIAGASSAYNAKQAQKGQEDINEQNRQWFLENRSFVADREDSAHQREVEDLKKAGINPVLTAGGGSGSPASAQQLPQQQNPKESWIKAQLASTSAEAFLKTALAKTEQVKQQKIANEANSAKSAADIMELKAQLAKELNPKITRTKGYFKSGRAKNDWKFFKKYQKDKWKTNKPKIWINHKGGN